MKLLAIGVGFVCGCWLGIASAPDETWHAMVPIVGKWAPLVAGPLVLGRWRMRRAYIGSRRRT
jgi:hypothetical protein